MRQPMSDRIQAMYQRDCCMAWFDVALLWAVVLFVLVVVLDIVQQPLIRLVLVASSVLLIVFNTAAVFALTRQLRQDKALIYGEDIQHLDANRIARRLRWKAP